MAGARIDTEKGFIISTHSKSDGTVTLYAGTVRAKTAVLTPAEAETVAKALLLAAEAARTAINCNPEKPCIHKTNT